MSCPDTGLHNSLKKLNLLTLKTVLGLVIYKDLFDRYSSYVMIILTSWRVTGIFEGVITCVPNGPKGSLDTVQTPLHSDGTEVRQ